MERQPQARSLVIFINWILQFLHKTNITALLLEHIAEAGSDFLLFMFGSIWNQNYIIMFFMHLGKRWL